MPEPPYTELCGSTPANGPVNAEVKVPPGFTPLAEGWNPAAGVGEAPVAPALGRAVPLTPPVFAGALLAGALFLLLLLLLHAARNAAEPVSATLAPRKRRRRTPRRQ